MDVDESPPPPPPPQTPVAEAEAAGRAEGATDRLAHVRGVREAFRGLFAELTQALSVDELQPLFGPLRNPNSTLNVDECLVTFRENLLLSLVRHHDSFWEQHNVDDSLACLQDMLDASYQRTASDGWRPTGRSAEEQMRFYRAFLLRAKIGYLQKQNKGRPTVHQNLIVQLEALKARMNSVRERNERLMHLMAMRTGEIDRANQNIGQIQGSLYRDQT